MANKFTLLSKFATILSTIKAPSWRSAVLLPFITVLLNAATGTATQTLSAQINAISKLSVPASLTVANAGTTFVAYAGNLAVSYRARTTASTGSGSLTLKATADFSPAGGPSIASGQLTYTCSSATLGTACSGTQTASTTSQTNVVTLGASACTGGGGSCSSVDPNTVQTSFTLTNTTALKTGSYSVTLTFTGSAI
ncbi:MAG: hypothetical protein ACR2JB_23315 [Bryobacteraceae bacterium]